MNESNICVLRRLNNTNLICTYKVEYKLLERKRKPHKGICIFLHEVTMFILFRTLIC